MTYNDNKSRVNVAQLNVNISGGFEKTGAVWADNQQKWQKQSQW